MKETKVVVCHLANYGPASVTDYERKIQKAIDAMQSVGWELIDQTVKSDALQTVSGRVGFVVFLFFQREAGKYVEQERNAVEAE